MGCLSLIRICWLDETWTELEMEGSESKVDITKLGHSDIAEAAAANMNARYLGLCDCREGI